MGILCSPISPPPRTVLVVKLYKFNSGWPDVVHHTPRGARAGFRPPESV